jgi:hypothetical protein
MGRGIGTDQGEGALTRSGFHQQLRGRGSDIAASTARKVGNLTASDLMLVEKRRQWDTDLEVLQHEDSNHDLKGQHLLEEREELLQKAKELREARAVSRANGGSGAGVIERQAQEHYQSMATWMEDLDRWRACDAELRERHSKLRAADKALSKEEHKRFKRRKGAPMTFPQKLQAADKALLLRMQSVFSAKRSAPEYQQARAGLFRSAPIHEKDLPAKVGKAIEGVFDEFLDILWENWPPMDPSRY